MIKKFYRYNTGVKYILGSYNNLMTYNMRTSKCWKKNFSTKEDRLNVDRKNNQTMNDNFFYDKENIDNTSSHIISIEKNKNMVSKLKLNEDSSMPLVENEEYRELYRNFSLIVSEDLMKSLDDIKHNQKDNDVEYKYGLPSKNNTIFTALIPKEEEEYPKTSTENLFSRLQLDKDSSYESLLLKFQIEFNHGI
jgi:hypothetical protein